MPDPISNSVVAAGGAGLMALIGGALKWAFGREVARLDSTLEHHGKAIDALEKDHVGKTDITALGDRLERTMNRAVDKMDAQFEKVHARIDNMRDVPPR